MSVSSEEAAAEIERLRADNERLIEALKQIVEWARAYPLTVFPEPDFVKARALLEAGGITLDAISASNMRHVVTEVAASACRGPSGPRRVYRIPGVISPGDVLPLGRPHPCERLQWVRVCGSYL